MNFISELVIDKNKNLSTIYELLTQLGKPPKKTQKKRGENGRKKTEKVGPIPKGGGGGFPRPNFFLKAEVEKTEKNSMFILHFRPF